MRFLFTVFLCSILTQLSPIYAKAPIKEEDIAKKIDSFPDTETDKKEKWAKLLQHRKELNSLEDENKRLTNSNKTLTNQEDNILKPKDLKEVSAEIKSPTLAQITDRVSEIKQRKEALENLIDTNKKLLLAAENRQKLIPDEINKTQSDLTVLRAAPDPTDEVSIYTKKEIIAKLESKLKKLNLEQINLERKIPILKTNLLILSKNDKEIEKLFTAWNVKLIDANKDTAASIKASSQGLAAKLTDGSRAKEIAENAITLSSNLLSSDSIHSELKNTSKELSELKQTFHLIEEQQKYAKDRIDLLEKANISIGQETGTLLRKQRSELPTEKYIKHRLTTIVKDSTQNELALLKEREHHEAILAYPPDLYESSLTDAQKSELTKKEFDNLISSTKKLHKIVISERETLSTEYRELIALLQKTHQSSQIYSTYIDKRLLWIVSHPTIGKQSFIDEASSLKSLYGIDGLTELFNALKNDAINSPFLWALIFALSVGLVLFRKKLRQWKNKANKAAERGNCQSYMPTLTTLICDILITSPLPSLLAFLAWRTPFGFPLQTGLYVASIICAVLGLTRRLCKPNGLFEANKMVTIGHLRMFRKVIQSLFIILPIVAATAISLTKVNAELTQGRLFNMLSLIIMAAAMHYILLPKKRMLSGKKNPGFLSYLAYFTFVIFPLMLVIVAASGYFISMLTLMSQLTYTIGITLLVIFVSALLKRWLLVTRRRALMNARKTALADPESALTEEEKKQEIQETVTKVSEQSTKLIRLAASVILVFSLITIWSNTLPALSVLDTVELWETTSPESSGDSKSAGLTPLSALSGASDKSSDIAVSNTTHITLQDLLITIIVSFFTYLAAVNIPSLLQITVLNHFSLKHGTAFTITTALRYIIIIVGIIWAFGSIGVTWNKIQWLAAAITLGIGFGLQEIFANFVAGLILLFERPIRIGDLITVGEINGKVSKIQMRATTILQFNNRELIVPNKEFITGQLVNWTLSDNVIRAEVPVGIAYGSDTQLAKSIMLECAQDNKRSLKEPKPDVIFSAFGASSLDFILRVYISSVDDLMPVQSEMHFAIDNAFREAGIEISFPQQDIHIRSIDAAFPTGEKVPTTD